MNESGMKPSIILPAVLLLISHCDCDHGVKTARHAYSSSSSGSNSFASSFGSGGSGSFKVGTGIGGDISGNPEFWWARADSPFNEAYEYFRRCSQKGDCANIPGPFPGVPGNIPNNLPQNGCNDNGCSFSGGFNVHDKNSGDVGPIDISKNPFLNGEYQGVAVSSCSGNACAGGKPHATVTTTNCKGPDCKSDTQHGSSIGDLNLSQNPFLNGAFGRPGSAGCSGVKGGCKGAPAPGGSGCNGAAGCTGGSSSHQFGFQAQFGNSGCSGAAGCNGRQPGIPGQVGGQIGGGSPSGCGPSGCGGGSGQSNLNVGGGCGGYGNGCKPGQGTGGSTSGSFSGSTSFGGQSGQSGQPGQPGYSQNIPSTYPGQPSGSPSGSFAGSGSTSGSFSGSGSTSSNFGSVGQGQSGQGPSTYPGQFGSGSTSGSFSGSGSTSFKPAGQKQPGYSPSTYPGQSGSGSTSGSFSGSGSTRFNPTEQGQSGPGPSTYPGQSGSGSTSGSFSGTGSTSFKPAGQGQPGYGQNIPSTYPGQTGQSSTTGSFAGSGSTSSSFGGQPGYNQNTPSYPSQTSGQPGSPGQSGQPGSPGQPGQPQTGYPGRPTPSGSSFGPDGSQPGQQGFPGQPGYNSGTQQSQTTSGSFSGSTSGSFSTTGQTDYTSNTQQSTSGRYNGAGSTTGTNQPSYSSGTSFGSAGSFAGSGSFDGRTTPSGVEQGTRFSGKLTIKCYGDGLICVKKNLCVDGVVNTNGDGLLNVRNGENYCDVFVETCCTLPNKTGRPFEDNPIDIPTFQGQTNFESTQSHQSSSATSSTSSSSSSATTSFGSSITGSTSPADTESRFTPGPTAGGVQPGGVKPNFPGEAPSGGYQPGQTITFGGSNGQSPGVIQVIPDGQRGTNPPGLKRPTSGDGIQQYQPGQAPGLRTTPGLQQFGPGQAPGLRTTPGLSQFGPGQAPGLRTTPGVEIRSNGVSSTPQNSIFDSTPSANEFNFASTLKGPAYLPPGPSPSPSPSSFSPDLLPPNRSPTTPRPSTYYPTPSTPAYLPPFSGSQTSTNFVPTTRKPQVTSGYLPPETPQVPSATSGNNEYLPPPDKQVPESNIINISVLPIDPTKRPPGTPDRDPQGTSGQGTFLRPSSPRPNTDFPLNTTPYPGCAAALKCVSGEFCTAEGVISKTRVLLTPEQENNRVPLTECQDPESGIIGKCCRDPEYKDPWPSTQLGLFNPDQDFQGSNPGIYKQRGNDGKYRPQPGVKGGRPVRPGGTRPINPYEPNQIGSPSNVPNAVIRPGGYPTDVPNIPFDSRLVNVPVQVDSRPPVEYQQKFPTSPAKNAENCGTRHPNSRPAGPGPIDASFGEIPWQAMILRDTNRSLLCGGAIIRRDVVLTAAHCIENLQSDDVLVKGGEWKLGIDEEPKPFQINKVAAIVRHPGYRPENRLNDVALLILKDNFRLDRNVDTLCLPDPEEDVSKKFLNAKCITTGWGKTILQLHILNSIMHILGVGIIPGNQCQQQLQQSHPNSANLYNTNCVCGAPIQQQSDICDVDIGSALACEGPDGRYTLAGIYSWDTGCNPTAQIAGYSRIDTQWVQQTLQRPIKDLKTEETGFYQQLAGQECHCLQGKK